ncbi:hypothetical protein, partial [Treponema sp. R6D11]
MIPGTPSTPPGLYQKAPPILPSDPPIASVAANDVAAAVNYAKTSAALATPFTLLLDADVTLTAGQNINVANFDLTIIG